MFASRFPGKLPRHGVDFNATARIEPSALASTVTPSRSGTALRMKGEECYRSAQKTAGQVQGPRIHFALLTVSFLSLKFDIRGEALIHGLVRR